MSNIIKACETQRRRGVFDLSHEKQSYSSLCYNIIKILSTVFVSIDVQL